MTEKKQSMAASVNLDQLSVAELDALFARLEQTLADLEGTYGALHELPESERKNHPGAAVFGPFGDALLALWNILSPTTPPKDPNQAKALGDLQKSFDIALSAEDDGYDPTKFEADLLRNRTYRARKQSEFGDRLAALARKFDDDALITGATVIAPGIKATEHARSLSKNNTAFKSLLSGVMDKLRAMTKAARNAPRGPKV
jgi:hypothetical protein